MRKKVIALALLSVLFLSGCGDDANVSQLTIDKEGAVKSYIVEEFTASYYNAEELQTGVTEDINYINEKYDGTVIELTKFAYEEGVVKATIEYQNANLYEEFNEEVLFVGTIEEAVAEKYQINATFYDAKNPENEVKFADIKDENYHIMIFTEPINVKVPHKVLYVSEGLQKGNSSKKVSVTDNTQEIYYIIYE